MIELPVSTRSTFCFVHQSAVEYENYWNFIFWYSWQCTARLYNINYDQWIMGSKVMFFVHDYQVLQWQAVYLVWSADVLLCYCRHFHAESSTVLMYYAVKQGLSLVVAQWNSSFKNTFVWFSGWSKNEAKVFLKEGCFLVKSSFWHLHRNMHGKVLERCLKEGWPEVPW